MTDKKVGIIGGCGHVGIPLGLVLADNGCRVTLIDTNQNAVDKINSHELPFLEEGAEAVLRRCGGKSLFATTDIQEVRKQDVIIFVVGTPVDEHLSPKINDVLNVIKAYMPFLRKNQLVVLRSTVFPGVTAVVYDLLLQHFENPKLAFCPERIVQGKGIRELYALPQIVSGIGEKAVAEAADLFSAFSPKIVYLEPREAELAKLMTNTWRYIEFAIANQFYMLTEREGMDFYKILNAIKNEYPRARHYASAGLAAGPCLFKDCMQMVAFSNNQFFLGTSAMLVNEGLPKFLVERMEQKINGLAHKKIALLGMTFKPDNDDTRESLSFKLKKELEFKMAEVLPVDPYVEGMMNLKEAIDKADGVILGVPHREFRNLKIGKPYVDCWNIWRS